MKIIFSENATKKFASFMSDRCKYLIADPKKGEKFTTYEAIINLMKECGKEIENDTN